jgi:hypothetical protein
MKTIVTIGLIAFGLSQLFIIYQLFTAPIVDEDGNIIDDEDSLEGEEEE